MPYFKINKKTENPVSVVTLSTLEKFPACRTYHRRRNSDMVIVWQEKLPVVRYFLESPK